MGSIQSNITKQALSDVTNVVNQNVTNVINTSIADCAAGNVNSFTTGILPNGTYCPFSFTNGTINLNQTVKANCVLNSQNTTQVVSDFSSLVNNAIQQAASQSGSSTQGWLATAVSFQVNGLETDTQIINNITNYVQNNVKNTCQSSSQAFNNGQVALCGVYSGSSFNITQDATVTALTSCINQTILDAFVNNSVLNQLSIDTDQKLTSQQSGIGSFFIYIAIIFAVVAVLGIIGGIIYAVVQGKSSDTSDILKKAAELKAGKAKISTIPKAKIPTKLSTIKV
jgi:hypothetical protein